MATLIELNNSTRNWTCGVTQLHNSVTDQLTSKTQRCDVSGIQDSFVLPRIRRRTPLAIAAECDIEFTEVDDADNMSRDCSNTRPRRVAAARGWTTGGLLLFDTAGEWNPVYADNNPAS